MIGLGSDKNIVQELDAHHWCECGDAGKEHEADATEIQRNVQKADQVQEF